MEGCIKVAFSQVVIIMEEIHDYMDELKKRIEYHLTKYFYKWRTMDCADLIEEIEICNNKLNERLDLFIKLLKL